MRISVRLSGWYSAWPTVHEKASRTPGKPSFSWMNFRSLLILNLLGYVFLRTIKMNLLSSTFKFQYFVLLERCNWYLISVFFKYMRDTWIRYKDGLGKDVSALFPSSLWGVYERTLGGVWRTSNNVEAWHESSTRDTLIPIQELTPGELRPQG